MATRVSDHVRAKAAGVSLDDASSLAMLQGSAHATARVDRGSPPPAVLAALVEHLRGATTTPGQCFFAIWEGWADSVVPNSCRALFALPHRRYHVFAGPIEGAVTSLSSIPFHRSANLWPKPIPMFNPP